MTSEKDKQLLDLESKFIVSMDNKTIIKYRKNALSKRVKEIKKELKKLEKEIDICEAEWEYLSRKELNKK